jgi:hypothetical protein
MSETASDITVKITAEPRAHPAIRQLARACIALARQRDSEPTPSAPTSRMTVPSATQSEGVTADSVQEQPHA